MGGGGRNKAQEFIRAHPAGAINASDERQSQGVTNPYPQPLQRPYQHDFQGHFDEKCY